MRTAAILLVNLLAVLLTRSLDLLYHHLTGYNFNRLRDDIKYQSLELTTVQSKLRDCQTLLSTAEVRESGSTLLTCNYASIRTFALSVSAP